MNTQTSLIIPDTAEICYGWIIGGNRYSEHMVGSGMVWYDRYV